MQLGNRRLHVLGPKLYSTNYVSCVLRHLQGVNKWTDLTGDEWRAQVIRGRVTRREESKAAPPVLLAERYGGLLPAAVNWTAGVNGVIAVTPVKDQGQCGSCVSARAMEARSPRPHRFPVATATSRLAVPTVPLCRLPRAPFSAVGVRDHRRDGGCARRGDRRQVPALAVRGADRRVRQGGRCVCRGERAAGLWTAGCYCMLPFVVLRHTRAAHTSRTESANQKCPTSFPPQTANTSTFCNV